MCTHVYLAMHGHVHNPACVHVLHTCVRMLNVCLCECAAVRMSVHTCACEFACVRPCARVGVGV